MSDLFFAKPKGKDDWYSPERDILKVWPSCLIRGAAFAVDPASDIYAWLVQQDGINTANVAEEMRKCVLEVLSALRDCKTAPLNEALTPQRFNWTMFKGMMFGASMLAFSAYNNRYREARLTNVQTGKINEPVAEIDEDMAISVFDRLVKEARTD